MNNNIELQKISKYVAIISFSLGMFCLIFFYDISNDNSLYIPIVLLSGLSLMCSFFSFIFFILISLHIHFQIRAERKKNYLRSNNIPKQNQSNNLPSQNQEKLDKNAEYWRNRNARINQVPDKKYITPAVKQIDVAKLNIHEEIKNLIYYSDCDIINDSNDKLITLDPSFIDEALPVVEYKYDVTVEKLDYYPSYRNMTPIQRGKYLKYLENPYDDSYEIGYVFTLFYGLESQLIIGNKSQAAFVINKLRQHHDNKSFQGYSFDALLFFFALRNELLKFLEYEYDGLSFEYSVIYHFLTDGIYPSNLIMSHKKAFGLKKEAYINRDPILFQYELNNQLFKKYNISGIPLSSYFTGESMSFPYFSFPANMLLKSAVMQSTAKIMYFDNSRKINYEPFKQDVGTILNDTYDIAVAIHKSK